MVYLSKSKYCGLWQCPKTLWLKQYKPEKLKIAGDVQSRMDAGNEVGDLAMGLFGDYVEVTVYNGEQLDLAAMLRRTEEEMGRGTANICEASFSYHGLYCAVDILRKTSDGWAIYEVKSSTKHLDDYGRYKDDKEIYLADIAYQKYVLEHCGIHVTGTFLVCLNGDYVRHGELDVKQLFLITDVAESIKVYLPDVEYNVSVAEEILQSDEEPDIGLNVHCNKPYKCGFWDYCSELLPIPSVFNLYRLKNKKKVEYYRNGWASFEALEKYAPIKNETQLRQIDFELHDRDTYIDRAGIWAFLQELSYPLYFLDFETMQPVIPRYEGTHPYQQITFQYSMHYIEHEGGELKHKEFLAESGPDPRRALAEQLCADIPMNVCTTAYNKSFECTRLKELAAAFPDLAEHLLNIRDNIKDLLVPFQSGYYYNRAMGGSFSIKSVLPAIFPDDPALDYHNLEGVHNGGEAMTIFPKIKDLPPAEQEIARRNLLKYCELDTYAMVKVWEELVRVGK